jgi:DNA-binding response OmpR family regulator
MTKILIVEDDPMLAQDLQLVLERCGYEVVGIARSATEAIAETGKYCPDLTLMDVNIDGSLDGIQTAQMLNSTCRMPIIFLTSAADEQTVFRALEERSFGYLLKPVNQLVLNRSIRTALLKFKTITARTSPDGRQKLY